MQLAVDEEAATLAGGERCQAVLKADRWRLRIDLMRREPHFAAMAEQRIAIDPAV